MVVLDNLYAYGPSGGHPLRESGAVHPTSAKAATRAAMTAELLAAHDAGRVEVAIGRASDDVGPGVTRSALGEAALGAVLSGRTVQVMGDRDQPHSYSYAPDVAAGLRLLGEAPAATGRVWHLRVDEPQTTRAVIEELGRAAGRRVRVRVAGPTALRLVGLVQPEVRELRHTLYQFSEPRVVDDGDFRRTFGVAATPLDQALATTLAWFRSRLAPPAPVSSSPPATSRSRS